MSTNTAPCPNCTSCAYCNDTHVITVLELPPGIFWTAGQFVGQCTALTKKGHRCMTPIEMGGRNPGHELVCYLHELDATFGWGAGVKVGEGANDDVTLSNLPTTPERIDVRDLGGTTPDLNYVARHRIQESP